MQVLKRVGLLFVGIAFLVSLLIPVAASANEPLPPIYPPPPETPPPSTGG
jgi:hypothetical protein